MAGKKATFTCKVCDGEHSGLICTAFGGQRGIRVLIADRKQEKSGVFKGTLQLVAPVDVVSEPVNVTNKTRDRPKKLRDAPVPKRRGPKPKGKQAMTAAERQAARRARQKAAK